MKKTKMDSTNEVLNGIHSVRFNEIIYTDDNPDEITIRRRSRRKSGILKRRENTLRTADAPPIILSDEGLKAGRVSPFINLTLFLTMTLRSIGIVFGDIGTSPLYVVKTIFDQEPTEKEVIGAISLIVWSLIVVVSLKYAIFILIADNRGEGGPFALCSLLIGQTSRLGFRSKQFVSIISMLAACLLIGDGALTPAVSILSACEGLVVAKQSLDSWTVRISVILIIILFLLQRWGPSKIGILFGPIMVCWFIVLLIIGIWRVTDKPIILKSFNPWQALKYLIKTKKKGFFQIGSIFLSVTGLETLYADLGHFGRWPVRFSWFTLVFPSVLFNYLGQGALLILYPQHIDNPFYHSVPNWALWPIIIFSIISSTIASQAVITGSFTLVSQAVAMGFCVPFDVIHTSRSIISHIYVPAANYFLLFLTLTVTIGFQSSGRITDAYGVTVCSVMVITTILYMLVMRFTWSKPIWLILCFSIFLIIDLYTFAAICTTKIDSGGWVAIIIAFSLFVFSFSWYYGNLRLNRFLTEHYQTNLIENLPRRFQFQGFQHLTNDEMEEEIDDDDDDDELHRDEKKKRKVSQPESTRISLVETNLNTVVQDRFDEIRQNETIKKTVRIPGVGCYLTTSKRYTPYVFENFVKRMNAHQEILIFLKVEYARTPSIDDEQRLIVRAFDKHIYHITSTFGYDETNINLLNILQLAHQQYDIPIDTNQSNITFILPYQSIHVITYGWRTIIRRFPLYIYALLKGLFPGMPLNFKLIPDNTVQLGILADV